MINGYQDRMLRPRANWSPTERPDACPRCGGYLSRVVFSAPLIGTAVRIRRRACDCGARFKTAAPLEDIRHISTGATLAC